MESIDVGAESACGLTVGGQVACLGEQFYNVHVPPAAVAAFSSVTVGKTFACGIDASDDTVRCWGDGMGYCAVCVTDAPTTGAYSRIDAGRDHACALATDGTASCWGSPTGGKTQVPSDSGFAFRRVSAGTNHSCAINTQGLPLCWGSDTDGRSSTPDFKFTDVVALEDRTCGIRETTGRASCWGGNLADVGLLPLGTSIALGPGYGCVLTEQGQVECWGNYPALGALMGESFSAIAAGTSGVCGITTPAKTILCSPAVIGNPTDPAFDVISGHGDAFCALDEERTLRCWGSGSVVGSSPTNLFRALDVGSGWACAVHDDGTQQLSCWGDNIVQPVELSPPLVEPFREVAISDTHGCALSEGGAVACWGANTYGQATPPSGQFASIAVGTSYSCARRSSGEVVCWGKQARGLHTSDF